MQVLLFKCHLMLKYQSDSVVIGIVIKSQQSRVLQAANAALQMISFTASATEFMQYFKMGPKNVTCLTNLLISESIFSYHALPDSSVGYLLLSIQVKQDAVFKALTVRL